MIQLRKHITTLLRILVILVLANGMHAQNKMEKRKEKMEALKIAYITEELDLSQEEWQIFWPLYNEYNKEKPHEKFDALKLKYEKQTSSAENILDELIKTESEELDRKHAYMDDLRSKLGADVVLKMNHLEQKFKHRLLRKYKDRGKRKGN